MYHVPVHESVMQVVGQAASARTGGSPEALTTIAQAQRQLGADHFVEAMKGFETLLLRDSHNLAARAGEHSAAIDRALELRNAGDTLASLQTLEHARSILPDDPILLTDLGIEADSLHRLPEALDALQAALVLRPGEPTATYALARTELDSDHPVKAEALFRAYLAQRPGDASAHYGLGHLLQMQQRSDESAQEFHRSIEIKPVQTESYYQLGQMDLDAHRDVVARPLFEKTLSRMPTHGGALVGLGILDFRAKNYLSARRELDAAVASTPDYEPAHYYLGLTLARLGDKAASERELAVASSLNIKQQGKAAPVGVIDGPP
jgi:tetratricopeptide (TPR) repeat protein